MTNFPVRSISDRLGHLFLIRPSQAFWLKNILLRSYSGTEFKIILSNIYRYVQKPVRLEEFWNKVCNFSEVENLSEKAGQILKKSLIFRMTHP